MPSAELYADTRAVAELAGDLVDAMWTLFAMHYTDVGRASFERDLRGKDHVFLLMGRADGVLRGFSTVQSYVQSVAHRRVLVIYSGDTICDPRFWGQRVLHSAFLRYVMRRKLAHPFTPAYWFLISKGYKTYLLLARNFVEYWPRPERDTPAFPSALLDTLAREKFGHAWLPREGILRFAAPMGRLRPNVAPAGARELANAHIRFFAERNPGAPAGDELGRLGGIGVGLALNYARRRALRA
ncbi:MAG: hypothetical protein ABJD07_04900, partial [Gemmatimonadaceae bacterium]